MPRAHRSGEKPSPTDSLAALKQLFTQPQARVLVAERDGRHGYRRDPRIVRYVGTLPPERERVSAAGRSAR
jgi:hypothetical protein